jgi:general secretion pathway protein G
MLPFFPNSVKGEIMKKGFTLIELLVVITILAVLAGAALPYVQNYVEESRIAKAKTDLEEIARALAVYETREGDYPDLGAPADGLSDVSQLTGRYLNKSPIDPWGRPYVVDINAGSVYSTGPDRDDTDPAGKYDNISFPYQPPLALVSAKWIDRNQSGSVDAQNVPDQIQLTFSRKLSKASADCTQTNLAAWLTISPDGQAGSEVDITDFVQHVGEGVYDPVILTSNPKVMVLSLNDNYDPTVDPEILLGAAYIYVDDPTGTDADATTDLDNLSDLATNLSLQDQNVTILPQ